MENLPTVIYKNRLLDSWSLASEGPVLGLKRVCPRKVGPWPWPRVFL